jgi:hypothetical protein
MTRSRLRVIPPRGVLAVQGGGAPLLCLRPPRAAWIRVAAQAVGLLVRP